MFVGIDYSNSYCGWQLIYGTSLGFFVEIKMVVLQLLWFVLKFWNVG